MSLWKRKKPKEELELKEEEREASISFPFFKCGRKRRYVPKNNESQKAHETSKKPCIFEDTVEIKPDHYEPIDLGELQRGTTIALECSEKEGENFSFLVLDDDNFKTYKKYNTAPKSLAKDSGENEYKEKFTVAIAGQYYLVLTTRATDYTRKVWYRVEIGTV